MFNRGNADFGAGYQPFNNNGNNNNANNNFNRFGAKPQQLNGAGYNNFGNFNANRGGGQMQPRFQQKPRFNNNNNNNNNYGNNRGPQFGGQNFDQQGGALATKRKAESYTCTVCSIEVSSAEVLQSHMNGQKHAKKLRQIQQETQSKPAAAAASSDSVTDVTQNADSSQQSTGTDGSKSDVPFESKHILVQFNEFVHFHKLKSSCEVTREIGPPHARTFEVKCCLFDLKTDVLLESAIATGTSINRAKQSAVEQVIKQSPYKMPTGEELRNARQAKLTPKKPRNAANISISAEAAAADGGAVASNSAESASINTTTASDSQHAKQKRQPRARQERPEPIWSPLAADGRSYGAYTGANNALVRQYLFAKNSQIQPDKQQLELVDALVTRVELALKDASDTLLSEKLSELGLSAVEAPSESTKESDAAVATEANEVNEGHRQLKGVVRAGVMAKGLLLKTDLEHLGMFVIASDTPTLAFINRVGNLIEASLAVTSAAPIDGKFKLENRSESALKSTGSFTIKYTAANTVEPVYSLKLSFTALVLPAEGAKIDIAREALASAITEMQRLKWFNSALKPLNNAKLILRVLRDLGRRSPTWATLSDTLLELIVAKCFHGNLKYGDLAFKFRSVLECLSSGVLLLDKLQLSPPSRSSNKDATTAPATAADDGVLALIDPNISSESTSSAPVYAYDYLSLQQREDITASAQHALRLLSLKRVQEILAVDENLMKQMPPRFNRHAKAAKTVNSSAAAAGTEAPAGNNQATEAMEQS